MAKRIRPSIQLITPEDTAMTEETATTEVADTLEKTATTEVSNVRPVTLRPVTLRSASYHIRNPYTNVVYSKVTMTDLNDLNAPESHFERSQVEHGVLIIVKG